MGKLIALDNGHGLNTGGKRTPFFTDGTVSSYTGENFMHEWEFNRAVVVLLKLELERCGFSTLEISPTEEDTDLNARSNIANKAGADFFLSVHANAAGGTWGTGGNGIETLTYNKGEGLRIGKILQSKLVEATGLRNRGMVDGSWLAVVKYTKMSTALVECGFMDNMTEAKLLLSEDYRKTCAVALAQGICEAFNVSYVCETPAEPYDYSKELAKAMVGKGIITDADYWKDVIEGRIVPKPVYVQYLFENILKKM